jgi:signal transduction histidine kinase/MFS family permease
VSPYIQRQRPVSWRRLLAAGLLVAALAGVAGGALELWRFGPTDATAAARVESYVRRDFAQMTEALSGVATRIASNPVAATSLTAEPEEARALFDLVAAVRQQQNAAENISVTVYGASHEARAWSGRPSDIPADRISGPPAYFVTPSPLGLRLVHVEPIVGSGQRRGAVAVEYALSPASAAATIAATNWMLSTPLAPASLRTRYEGAGDHPRPGAFLLRSQSGEPLVEASVASVDLQQARDRWRRRSTALVAGIAGIAILLLIGPALDRRVSARDERTFARATVTALVLLALGGITLWCAFAVDAAETPRAPVALMLGGFCATAMMAILALPAARLRLIRRSRRRWIADAPLRFAILQIVAGIICTALIVEFDRLLDGAVDPVSFDLRHFSLHPWVPARLALIGGILAFHIAALWAGALILVAAVSRWRLRRSEPTSRALLLTLWTAPAVAGSIVSASRGWPVPALALMFSALACALAALFGPRIAAWYRHATMAARILALFSAFLVPALLLYPAMDFFADRATRRLIATQYAVQAQNHPQALQDRLKEAQAEIDALTILPDVVTESSGLELSAPRTESAFLIWRQTVLARERLTSAIELYTPKGVLISRFALNLPEYTGLAQTPQAMTTCTWDVFGEAAPFGSEERRMLHAERGICANTGPDGAPQPVGTIIVHVAFDYRTLPFISSQSPYFEVFRPSQTEAPGEGTAGGDVDVVIYGWSLRPIYASGRITWPLTDDLFQRIYASRDPFWARVRRAGDTFNVYFSNDRNGIYALGYPVLSVFDHLVHLAELTTLAGAVFVLVLIGTAQFARISRERPRVGRALLREIRASFYRKLFLAFVLASIIPVLTLALVIRTYFASLLQAGVEGEAARTAAVAQRVIEESDALVRRGEGLASVSDDVMVWIGQVIDQDVNIFHQARLLATSERDLFNSGLLPTRTPDEVYRAIVLQRRPIFVGEDQIGTVPYMIAAAPVRAGGVDRILTVPQGSRQREIEREIDDLDRGVHLASLFFILLGAAIGLWMAERIADPVRRLTRATQRIAHGDFDAHIAVKTADELKRLVDAFNGMAAELKTQRTQLERTHRLEAWAEMARQVAHEIKNPLTPIQLSAEHLRRVHVDRGEPLGPVVEGCVNAILGQVRLLRQISAEFSSFASSPTARPAAVNVVDLVAEVVNPYRTGLEGRIEIVDRVPPQLPRVFVDRTLIARALANVIENALHAMPGPGLLTIDGWSDGPFVTLEIRDTGVGMDEEALDRVFEPYFSTKTTGTGLGLPIARRNIELSGGAIEVESEKTKGTVVRLKLPIAD